MTLVHKLFNLTRSSSYQPEIELLSREGCHLCDDAFQALQRHFETDRIRVVDITSSQELEDEFVFRIPVVRFKGDVIAEGIIGAREARQAERRARHLRHAAGKGQ